MKNGFGHGEENSLYQTKNKFSMLHRNGRDLSIAKAVMQPMKKKLTINSDSGFQILLPNILVYIIK